MGFSHNFWKERETMSAGNYWASKAIVAERTLGEKEDREGCKFLVQPEPESCPVWLSR